MRIALLCFASAVLAAAVYLGLTLFARPPAEAAAQAPENAGQEAPEEAPAENRPEKGGRRKRAAYCFAMLCLLCALSVVLSTVYPGNTLLTDLRLLCVLAVLFAAAATDYLRGIIPNRLILAALAVRVVLYMAELITLQSGFWPLLKDSLLGCIIPAFFLLVGLLLIRNGLGMGDVKLLLAVALFQGLTGAVSSVFISLIIAFILSVLLLILKKKTRKDTIPFAPSVLIGTLVSVFLTGM